MTPLHLAAFSEKGTGGNPAGVVITHALPSPDEMQSVAADLGYSETAFAAPEGDAWRVRYFAPVGEVAFCGHATIALGAALGAQQGPGRFALNLRDGPISVEASQEGGIWSATLQSPRTWSRTPLDPETLRELLTLFGLEAGDLAPEFGPALAFAGVRHAVVCLRDRDTLARMAYPFEAVRDLMARCNLTTINLLHITAARVFSSRNAFASGGVVEDPATGAAAAALGGLLVDRDWDGLRAGGAFTVMQGHDMGQPSRIEVRVTGAPTDSVRVTGTVRAIA
jgi:PhzF family phenazine biosynthesis protein